MKTHTISNYVVSFAMTLASAGALLAAQYTNYYYNWTGAAGDGDFNNSDNWEEVSYKTTSKINDTYRFPHLGPAGGKVTLSGDFSAARLVFTNAADQAVTTLDLNGHSLVIDDLYGFNNHSPVVLTNGTLAVVPASRFRSVWGLPDQDSVDVRFLDMQITSPNHYNATYNTEQGGKSLFFKDSVITNFPGRIGIGSNSEIIFDNCVYSKQNQKQYFGFYDGQTNSVIRFSNGSTLFRYSGDYTWSTPASAADNKIIVDSGACFPFIGKSGNVHTLDGTNNLFAVSNACANGFISLWGISNRVVLSNAALTNETNYGIHLRGYGNKLVFAGQKDEIRLDYIDCESAATTNACIEVEDGVTVSNKSFNLRIFASKNSAVKLGRDSVLHLGYLKMTDGTALPTNTTFEVGEDAILLIGSQHTDSGFHGYNTRLVLNNGTFRFTPISNYHVTGSGGSIELNGDKARYLIDGYFTFAKDVTDHPELCTKIIYRPGPTWYGGEAPFRPRSDAYALQYSTMGTNTVIEVDLGEYLKGKRIRHHRLPLIPGNPANWDKTKNSTGLLKPNLERLTETLILRPTGRTRNERIIYDPDLDAICLDFDQKLGLIVEFF